MAFYYILFFFFVVVAVARDLFFFDKRLLLFVCFLILFFVAGFRDVDLSKDGGNYVNSFELAESPIEYFTNYQDWIFFEPLYYLLPAVLKLIFPGSYVLLVFLIYAIIGVHLNFRGIFRLTAFPLLAVVVYFAQNFLLHEMTQIRVGVACGFLLLAIYYHYHKRHTLFFATIAVSFLFHYVSILILAVYSIKPHTFSKAWAAGLLGIALVLSVSRSDFLIAPLLQLNVAPIVKLVKTLQSMDEARNAINIFNVGFLINLALLTWLIIHADVIQQKTKYGYLIIKIHLLSVLLYFLFTSVSMIAFRLNEFFGIINVVSAPLIVYTFRSKLISYSLVVMYSLLILIINLHVVELLQPYSFFKF
jgi:hypothetical protein